MARLGAHIRFFVRRKIAEDPAWQKPTVIFSGGQAAAARCVWQLACAALLRRHVLERFREECRKWPAATLARQSSNLVHGLHTAPACI